MSKAKRKYLRTVLLAIAALSSLIWMAIDQFDIPPKEMLFLFLYIAMGAGIVIGAAGLAVALFVVAKKLLSRGKEP